MLILFLPGFFLFTWIKSKNFKMNLETTIFSFGLSIFVIDFLVILLDKIGISINFTSILLGLLTVTAVFFFFARKNIDTQKIKQVFVFKNNKKNIAFFLIFLLAVILRLGFLSNRLTPHTTDLGHHMYWSNYIVQFEKLPTYDMPDFIIGEHIIFGALSILSGTSVISVVPIIIIFIINIFSLLAVYLFTRELIRKISPQNANLIALVSLLAIGSFYSSSSPQASFISGGVIGNIIGNLFLPLIFYSFIKAITSRGKKYFTLFLILILTLGYTHHLSSFMFLYSFIGAIVFMTIFSFIKIIQRKITFKELGGEFKNKVKNLFSWQNLLIMFSIIICIAFIWRPSYLNPSAVNIAVGDPSKSTRFGLTFNEIINTAGAWRLFYGFIGIASLFLIFLRLRKKDFSVIFSAAISIAWFFIIFMMSYKPGWLKVDIPSNRIGSYIVYPAAVLSAIGVFYLLKINKEKTGKIIFSLLFVVIFSTGFISGMTKLALNRETSSNNKELLQTFAAAEYLKDVIPSQDQKVLKDHNYLQGDTWMKLFFMQGYDYPLSRSLLRRYEDPAKPRETCTRDMISIPDSEIGGECFEEYGVKYIVLKKGRDDEILLNSENFQPLYVNDNVIIFQKK